MSEFQNEIPLYKIREPKVIHLSNIGTHHFYKHEIALIDIPQIQRLRYILQLGPVYDVFPTARHSRFEHSLGVLAKITQMWSALKENGSLSFLKTDEQEKILRDLRIGAIVHDIGHGPFSHVSEVVMDDFISIKSERMRRGCKQHELIGYFVLRSEPFRQYFDELAREYSFELNIDEITNYMLGKVENPENHQFKADLLNGQVDADKLDYIIRDSDFTGVQLALGIDRLLLALGIETIPDSNNKKIILNEKGIMPLEQLLLAKVILTTSIYHHQKVRAIDQMIISILRRIIDNQVEINGSRIESAVDLLGIDDNDILRLCTKDPKVNELCKNLKNRRTFNRALVVSHKTIDLDKDEFYSNQFWDILKLAEYPSELRILNQILADRIGNGCTEFDVAIDMPQPPQLAEASQKIIKNYETFINLKDVFPEKDWLDSYVSNKWVGHIFAKEEYRGKAQKEGRILLEEKFKFKFNDNCEKYTKFNNECG